MAKTAKDARRDIRELQEFLSAVKSASQELMEEFLARYKRKKYLKDTLRRYKKQGLIRDAKRQTTVTAKGRKFFGRETLRRKFLERSQSIKNWDGKWRLITFDVPIKYRKERDLLRSLLREFGFYQLQKSVWVYPDYMSEELWKLLVDYKLDKFCKVMLVEFMERDDEIKKYFFDF